MKKLIDIKYIIHDSEHCIYQKHPATWKLEFENKINHFPEDIQTNASTAQICCVICVGDAKLVGNFSQYYISGEQF